MACVCTAHKRSSLYGYSPIIYDYAYFSNSLLLKKIEIKIWVVYNILCINMFPTERSRKMSEIIKRATAGTMESSDAYVEISPSND